MSASAPRRMYRLFAFIPHGVSCISVVVGVLVLIGWEFDVATLKSVFSGLTVMKVNTAIGFIFAGAALWSIAMDASSRAIHIAAQVCASIISLLGLATLFEYLSGVNLGIDQFLVREITHLPGDIPSRMALNTALSFAAVGSALLLVSLRRRQFVVAIHALVLVPLIAAGSALIGYAYDIEEFLREKLDYTPMALHTANVFVLLALGVMTARADYPLRRFLRSTNPAGVMVRQLLPAAIVLTLFTGWLILRGFHVGHFGATFALALFTAVTIIWLGGLILWGARTVYQAAVQRERMEESLRSASQYVRSLIEASPDPLVTISAVGKITDVNEATVKATGVAREALIGRDFSDYFTEPDKARAGYQEVFAKGLVTDYPLSLQHVSGKVMEVLYNASVYRNAKGEVAGVFAAARDITQLRQNDAANASRLHLLQFAQTHSLDELLEETINEAERLTGSLIGFYHFVEEDQNSLTLQTWSTRTKAEFCKAEGKGLHYPIADAGVWADCVRQGKSVIHNDYAALPNRKGLPEGHAAVIRELVVPVRRGNKLSAILGVGNKPSDYTESDVEIVLLIADLTGEIAARKRAEEKLRAASLYTRSLIEASPDPLVTISVEGKITDVNEATVNATGVTREALIGSDFSNCFTEPDKARAGYQEVFAKGFVKDYPLALRHASGSMIEVLYNASVYRDANGEVTGVFAAARDVTELKRTENALKERVKELQAFYHLSTLAARKDFPLESLCQQLVNILPQSWQYPEIACARIVIRENEFRTANFRISEWMQAAPVAALGAVIGKVEVGYIEQKPEEHEGPFLKEERQLIDAIAERVGQIAELKHAEGARRASEELFRALANATSEGILIHEDGRIVEANRQMEDILGRPRAEIVGVAVIDLVAPAWRDMASRRDQTPDDTKVELAFVRPNGSEVIVSGLAHPCVYLGRPMRVAVYRDITLEKRAEDALRNVGTYNRSLIEVSLDPLVTISPDGKITDVNEATVQATGMPRSLLLGSDFSNYFTEPDKARAGYQEVFAKGFVADYPLCLRHVSGRTIDVLYNASVYRNAKGEVAGIFAAARDITERKRAEDESRHYHEHLEELVLERTSKLNAVNKDLEEFIYSMAHDLGIPLRAVNGFAHILLTEYRDKLDDEGKRYLDVVQDNTRRMGRLIDDILAFSRLRSAEITVSEINMEELAHEGLDELRPTFAGRELNVEIKPLRSARGDRTMLRQVWVNLLSNAIKFTREKSPARIEVGCVVEETELVYYVKDNGAGFDMQYANKLFGVFQRLHGVEEFEGQGIGLAMVKRIVTRHGGRVWAEGKLNEGATIYFALPAKGQEHG